MNPLIYFATISLLTIASGAAALALSWLLLRVALRMMRPAGMVRPALASSPAEEPPKRPATGRSGWETRR